MRWHAQMCHTPRYVTGSLGSTQQHIRRLNPDMHIACLHVYIEHHAATRCAHNCTGLPMQAHPEASKPSKQGPETPWTAGTVGVNMNADPKKDSGVKVGGGAREST